METALAALAQESDTDLEETDVQEILVGLQRITTVTVRATGELWLQARDRAHQWRETLSSWEQAQYRRADLTYTLPPLP